MLCGLFQAKADLGKASECYERILAIEPNSVMSAINLARIYADQNTKLDAALRLAQKASQMQPDSDYARDTLAWVYYKKSDAREAALLLRQCVRTSPNQAIYRYHLGMVLVAVGETAGGKAELSTALKLGLAGDDGQQAQKILERQK
jgi:tetratricopeptide (TPR) repeat protein